MIYLAGLIFLGVFLMPKATQQTFSFDYCFKVVVGHEGGFQKNPVDRGNWTGGRQGVGVLKGTKYGVSAMAYPNLDIENLTLDQAKEIYYRDYWLKLGLDKFEPALRLIAFDAAINHGVSAALSILSKTKSKNNVLEKLKLFEAERLAIYNRQPEAVKNVYLNGWKKRLANIMSLSTSQV